jgi:hypothetical protein
VGYYPAERCLELVCYLDAGRALPKAQVAEVETLLANRLTPEGRPLAAVRVVFLDADTAALAGLPLRKAGAETLYPDEKGELVRVVEP